MLGRLTYLYFNNSKETQNIDYTGLKDAKGLQTLYFLKPTDIEVEKMCTEMSKSDYKNLENLGLYGFKASWEAPSYVLTATDDIHSKLTTVSYLDKLSVDTKNSITSLYIQNNLLTSLEGIQNFKNLTGILSQYNNLTDISALSNFHNLMYLKLYGCGTGVKSLSALDGLTKLKNVFLTGTTEITSLKELITNEKNLNVLWADDLQKLDFIENSTFWTEENKNKLGKIGDLKLSPRYSMLFLTSNTLTLGANVTDDEFKVLKNNNYIATLDLNENKLVKDSTLQDVLPTLKKLKVLRANNSNLESLDWCYDVSDKTILNELRIKNTKILSIIPLKDFPNISGIITNGEYLKIYKENDEAFNTDTTKIINTACNSLNSGRIGFWPGSISLCNQLGKLTRVSKFWKLYG